MKKHKLRGAAPVGAEHTAAAPSRKLSETLLAFGEPLIAQLGDDASLPMRQQSMKLVITVWNAGAMAMPAWDKPELLRQFEQTLAQPGIASPMADLLLRLLVRRRELFGSDPRAVGEWELLPQSSGSYVLRCVAHLPAGPTHARPDPVDAGG